MVISQKLRRVSQRLRPASSRADHSSAVAAGICQIPWNLVQKTLAEKSVADVSNMDPTAHKKENRHKIMNGFAPEKLRRCQPYQPSTVTNATVIIAGQTCGSYEYEKFINISLNV